MRSLPVVLLACSAAALLPGARSVQGQLSTDRPDFVESALTVGRGRLQIETSAAFDRDVSDAGSAHTLSAPTLLRVGLGSTLELRLESDTWVVRRSPADGTVRGLADASVGLKWHTGDAGGIRPSTALLAHFDLPTGRAPLRGEGVRPSLRAVAEWDAGRGVSLGMMPGVGVEREDGEARAFAIAAGVVGKALTPSVRLFGEIAFQRIPFGAGAGASGSWNTGVAWLLSDETQLDLAVSLPATRGVPGFAMTIGYSRRIAWAR